VLSEINGVLVCGDLEIRSRACHAAKYTPRDFTTAYVGSCTLWIAETAIPSGRGEAVLPAVHPDDQFRGGSRR